MENVFKEACNALLVTITEIELGTADGSDEIRSQTSTMKCKTI